MNETEIKELMEDIQTGGGRIWDMRDNFPESMKGSMAKNRWNDLTFTYGMEYGALVVLNYLLKNSEFTTKDEEE